MLVNSSFIPQPLSPCPLSPSPPLLSPYSHTFRAPSHSLWCFPPLAIISSSPFSDVTKAPSSLPCDTSNRIFFFLFSGTYRAASAPLLYSFVREIDLPAVCCISLSHFVGQIALGSRLAFHDSCNNSGFRKGESQIQRRKTSKGPFNIG